MNVHDNVLSLIGRTPLVRLNKLAEGIEAQVYVKLESMNPGGSVKDRIGIAMLEAAERDGRIKPGDMIIEPTSGNTGIGVALAARLKGYRCLFVMTDKASQERIRYLKALGADVLIVSSAAKQSSPEYYWNTAKRLSEEMRRYKAPYGTWASRKPLRQWPREIPIDGHPADVHEAVTAYEAWLRQTRLPKLLLHARPGAIIRPETVAWAEENLPNLRSVSIGKGIHFVQEDHPARIGQELAEWCRGLEGMSSQD